MKTRLGSISWYLVNIKNLAVMTHTNLIVEVEGENEHHIIKVKSVGLMHIKIVQSGITNLHCQLI
jgi:hypothetical protein